MQDESSQGVSHQLSARELLERGHRGIEQLIALRGRAARLGRTITVRSVPRTDHEPYVYVIEGGGGEGEPIACSTLAEVERRVEGLEAGRSGGEAAS